MVVLDQAAADLAELVKFAEYLTSLRLAGCDVVVLDSSARAVFEENRRVLRWVARHVALSREHDPIRVASEEALGERIILAAADVRCDHDDLKRLCSLLDVHEVVEPHDFFDASSWWSGVDASSTLLHRAIEPSHGRAGTLGFRRSAIRALSRGESDRSEHPVRRFAQLGMEVHSAPDLFIRRNAPRLLPWLRARSRIAGAELSVAMKSAVFFGLLPMAMLLAVTAGLRYAAGFAGSVALASVALALRGRSGAGAVFPLRVCWFAPLWVLERSVSIYCALFFRLRGEPQADAGTDSGSSAATQAASGE